MRKLLILFALFDCVACSVLAQNKTTDSLKQLLASEKEDTGRVRIMFHLGRAYLYSKPDTTLILARQALELSRKIDFKEGEALALRLTGNVLMNNGNYPRALEAYLSGLKIAEETNDQQGIASFLGALGDVYFYQGDIRRSLDYSYQSLALHKKNHDSDRVNVVFIGLGDTYEKLNQLDSALLYTTLGYQMAISRNDMGRKAFAIGNLGNVLFKLGKFDSAMICFRSCVALLKQTNNQSASSEALLGMAKIFLGQHKIDSVLYYAKLSFNVAKETGFQEQILAASDFLANYYKSVRNVDSAYAYQSATITAKDSLFSQQKANQIQSMTYDESMRKQQIEDAKQQERIRLRQNALLGGLAALLIVISLLFINNRQKRRANVQLQKQKEEIDHKAHELSIQKENLQQSYNNIEQLGEIGRKITSSLSVEKIISTVYSNVNAIMDASVFGIGIYNETLKRIEFPATYEEGQALPFYYNSLGDQNRFAVICFKERKEIVMGNVDEEYKLHSQEVLTPHEGRQAVSLIYLPLLFKEKKLGVVTVQSFEQNAYSDYHLFMLQHRDLYSHCIGKRRIVRDIKSDRGQAKGDTGTIGTKREDGFAG